jgi:hypothetical protein
MQPAHRGSLEWPWFPRTPGGVGTAVIIIRELDLGKLSGLATPT